MTGKDISGRYLCAIFDDMRSCLKTLNFTYLPALIEEAQYRSNRMEDRLERITDIERYEEQRNKLREEIHTLKEERRRIKYEE